MEPQTNETKRQRVPKWLAVILLIGGLCLIIIGLLQIFGSMTSKALVNKFNEFQGPTAKTGDALTAAGTLLSGITAKEQAKDYAGVVADLQAAATKLSDAESAINSLISLTSEFKVLIDKNSDQNIKTAGLHFIDVSSARNTAVLKMTANTKEFINLVIPYYNGLIQGKQITLDEAKITAISEQLNTDSQSIAKISAELETATQDLAKVANFTLTKKE